MIEVSCGFDWGWRDDLAVFGWVRNLEPIQSDDETWKRRYGLMWDIFAPRDGKRNFMVQPWSDWEEKGHITVTEGDTTDVDALYRCLDRRNEEFAITSLAADANNCIEFVTRAQNDYGLKVFEFSQTCSAYNNPCREFIKAVQEQRIVHDGNPVVEWCVGHFNVHENTAGYQMPAKKNSKEKIDPIVATIMGIGEAMLANLKPRDYYEDNDFEAF